MKISHRCFLAANRSRNKTGTFREALAQPNEEPNHINRPYQEPWHP